MQALFFVDTNQRPINDPQKLRIFGTKMVQAVHQTLFPVCILKKKSGLATRDYVMPIVWQLLDCFFLFVFGSAK